MLRVDALAKVRGEEKFVEDLSTPDLLYARVYRSSHHHARLTKLDTSLAAEVPGVVCIITAADIPGINGFPKYSQDEPILIPVGEVARAKGTPIALVVATSQKSAQTGLDAVCAEYESLPHFFEIGPDDLSNKAGFGILSSHKTIFKEIDKAFDASDVFIESEYTTAFQEHAALERETVFGYIDGEGRVTVLGGTHEPHWQQRWIAGALNISPENVRFITPPTGGSFGGKQDPWPHIAVGLMTYLVQKPVRLVFSRSESFLCSPKRHRYHIKNKIGATNAGRLTGIRARIDANTGGYDSAGSFLPEYAAMAAGGPYLWDAADIYAQSVYSNAPKSGQFRGFGTPQSTFGLECTLDEMIEKLDADPIEFRINNMIQQSSTTFLGYPVAETLGYRQVLEALKPHYREFKSSAQAANRKYEESSYPIHYCMGIGIAGMWYRFGKYGRLRIEAIAEITRDGKFIIYCSAPEYGQGIETVMVQLASESLGVSRDQIKLINADTSLTPDSDVQGASRATFWVGNAVCQAAQGLKSEIIGTAAEMLDCDPDTLSFQDDRVVNSRKPQQLISFEKIAEEFDHLGKSRKISGFFDPSPLFPKETRPQYTPHFVTGAHLAEVRVDMDTGEVKVTRYVAVHDSGRVINPLGAQGQVEGGVIMGIGSALKENYIPGATTGFSDYILPTVDDIPDIKVILVEVPGLLGPMGAKGLGETAMLPSTPAVINAVSRAIGVRIRSIPATPENVFRAIRKIH
jgi:CO/xanthine dehydrogenase Mo-binding subunit